MFLPTNTPSNTWNPGFNAFNAGPWASPNFGCPAMNATPFANQYFAYTLNTLVTQAVQQAIWQTMQWQSQQANFQSQFQYGFQPAFHTPTPAQPFPFPQQWNTPTPQSQQPYATTAATPFSNQGTPFNAQYQGQYPTQFPQGTPGWLNGQNGPGYFGTIQFQHLGPQTPGNTPTNEVVEAATKRNGSR